jgi:hypothetical protein
VDVDVDVIALYLLDAIPEGIAQFRYSAPKKSIDGLVWGWRSPKTQAVEIRLIESVSPRAVVTISRKPHLLAVSDLMPAMT